MAAVHRTAAGRTLLAAAASLGIDPVELRRPRPASRMHRAGAQMTAGLQKRAWVSGAVWAWAWV